MKCEIIRDLLPSYLDGLTSEESNGEIERHMAECAECGEILQQMQKEIMPAAETERKKINPFRKLNQRMRISILAVLACCIAFGGVVWNGFVKGFAIASDRVSVSTALEEDVLWVNFVLDTGILQRWDTKYYENGAEIALRKVWKMPFDERGAYPNQFRWGVYLHPVELAENESARLVLNKDGQHLQKVTEQEATEQSVMVQNGNNPVSIFTTFEENNQINAITTTKSGVDIEEYTLTIDYGKEKCTYTLEELLDMAQ